MKRIFVFLIIFLVLASTAAGETVWKDLAQCLSGREVKCVASTPGGSIYAGTERGLFLTTDYGENWSRVDTGWGAKKSVNDIAIHDGRIYISTERGLYISDEKKSRWSRSRGVAARRAISSTAVMSEDGAEIYMAAAGGLFKSEDGGRNWAAVKYGRIDDEILEDYADDMEVESLRINSLAASRSHPGRLYIGTNDGVYFIEGDFSTTNRFTDEGLLEKEIRHIRESDSMPHALYAVSVNHIYYFDQSWQTFELPRYLGGPNTIIPGNGGGGPTVVATDRGLYTSGESETASHIGTLQMAAIDNYFKYEPCIRDTQDAAIEYAEVDPHKIKSWRTRANMSAIMPRLAFGIDSNSSDGIHWDAGQNPDIWVTGPENESTGWDITMSWELGELI
ncbi:MAG: hypothetical protein ABH875_03150, partial [Candidatus Omnitrophota bacterium]